MGVAGEGFTGTEPGKVVDIFLPAMMHWGMSFPQWSFFRTFCAITAGHIGLARADHLSAIVGAINASKTNQVKQTLEMDPPPPAGVSAMQKNYQTALPPSAYSSCWCC